MSELSGVFVAGGVLGFVVGLLIGAAVAWDIAMSRRVQ